MTFIEKLESFQQQLIGVGQTAAACDLQNIIEEYKSNPQKPIGKILLIEYSENESELAVQFTQDAIKNGLFGIGDDVFTHSPLADYEKTGELYAAAKQYYDSSIHNVRCESSEERDNISSSSERLMAAIKSIDEAMKAES